MAIVLEMARVLELLSLLHLTRYIERENFMLLSKFFNSLMMFLNL